MIFKPSRSAALERLAQFAPNSGRRYSNKRNFDNGPVIAGMPDNVSALSPWLHAGHLSEDEVIETALNTHSFDDADKFVSEVFWRVYFKGYLEQRPSIWRSYCEGRNAAFAKLDRNAGLSTAYSKAIEGRTGIDAFDTWVRELLETGYLHNHARMWFASIWIFTLKIDWHLGADFFLRHLIDGDAASNTLSWRWVAGLHTKGKTYLARPDNIEQYTKGRPDGSLLAQGLAEDAPPLEEADEHKRCEIDFPEQPADLASLEPFALLLHDEAASHAPLSLSASPKLVIGAARPDARSPLPISEATGDFARASVSSGIKDASQHFGCPKAEWDDSTPLLRIMAEHNVSRLVMPYLPTGWTRDALWPELCAIEQAGNLVEITSRTDRLTWPHAKAGFFKVKSQIPQILREMGLPA